MSPVSTETEVNGDAPPSVSALLAALYQAPDAQACYVAAQALAAFVASRGVRTLSDDGILDDLVRAARGKSGYERESSMVALEELFRTLGERKGAEPYLLPMLPVVLDRYSETGKGEVVKEAAERAAKQLIRLPPPEAVPKFMDALFEVLAAPTSKWKTKVGALDLLSTLPKQAPEQVAERLESIIPRVTTEMRDTKPEVSAAGHRAGLALCGVLENIDVLPFVPVLVNCMARPDTVPEAIKALSANVWVRDGEPSSSRHVPAAC